MNAAIVRSLSGLLAVLALSGCATSRQLGREWRQVQVQPGSVAHLTAFRAGTNLLIGLPVRGKVETAFAHWPNGEGTNDQHYLAVLSFDELDQVERSALIRRSSRVTVRDARQWQKLVQGIFRGVAPNQSGHGVLFLVENREVVVFRDASGKLTVVKLEEKPPGVIVDRTFNDADFSRAAMQLLEGETNPRRRAESQFLFVTGEDPAYVLIDLQQRLIVFLGYPADPETQPMEAPGWFALRAMHSLLIRSFIIAALKNPFTLIGRGFWHLGNSGAAMFESGSASPAGPPPPLCTGPGMDLAAWEKDLDRLVSARRHQGRIELFIDGEKYFPALIQSIENSSRSVDVLVFIFDTDDYAVKIADVLKHRSADVHVRVLMDEMGSLFAAQVPPRSPMPPDFQAPGDIQSYLESGSHVRVRAAANPWLTVDHRKCIIIDGQQAYVGGMNIGREYRYEWHDMMVRLTGPVVGRLEKDYRLAWAHAGWLGDYAYAWTYLFGGVIPRKAEIADGIDVRPLRTATGKVEIYRAQLEAIRRAKQYIYLENAYLDDDTIVRELIQARRRGVDVRVVLPAENDSGIMQTSNQVTANELVRNGIRVYAYPGMTHVKAAIYDGWACLGSANFDKMSLRISQELDVAFSDAHTVDRLKRELFEADFARSHELKGVSPLNWMDFVVKAFAGQL